MLKENEIISKVLLTIDKFKGNMASFKSAITDNEYTPSHKSCFTRTLIWKSCLITDSLKIQTWDSKLSDLRVVYHELLKREDMAVPWWKLPTDSPFYQNRDISRKSSMKREITLLRRLKRTALTRVSVADDPLKSPSPSRSRSQTPTYETSDSDLELLETIILDIDRLFPGEDFFHASNPLSITTKHQMIEILYLWAKCNPQVGYKQGAHEILGLIYINLYKEATQVPSTNTFTDDDLRILSLYDITYLLHDLFTIFNKFMVQSGIMARFYESEDVLWKSIESFNVMLMKVDQLIHYNLINKLKIESQLWIIRYLRLLLSRELGNDLSVSIFLWDKLIASQLSNHNGNSITAIPDLIMIMTIQLLIQLKTELITCDFGECLSLLLHYPISAKLAHHSTANDFIFHLYKDAVKLYQSRDDDLKLYELGIKLNNTYNPNLKITMSYTGSAKNSQDSSRAASPRPSTDSKAEKLKFEKYRLEMRLKKKAQLMINNTDS
ncbi:RabGAP/TBC [Suhomyces tanzawaensis NRRL Y-17324]|uniref:RabGAP/TBC n=1 Tax=Suhomyces tanzawaensis NRRL Y-17324 TaxID=984487 RepID=A0A1E4SRJ5_9ASCO|nr:RabGAP/TBC [Suhomyces tanzawaensis NRRL Y-17324]ODV82022.1 RabGAP/TBC [Suhomyces tanzawaensis NRRL Y-17324]